MPFLGKRAGGGESTRGNSSTGRLASVGATRAGSSVRNRSSIAGGLEYVEPVGCGSRGRNKCWLASCQMPLVCIGIKGVLDGGRGLRMLRFYPQLLGYIVHPLLVNGASPVDRRVVPPQLIQQRGTSSPRVDARVRCERRRRSFGFNRHLSRVGTVTRS